MRRLPALILNLALVLLTAGAAGWSIALVRDTGATTTKASSSTRTVTVAQGTVTSTVTADGTLATATTASASFDTSGTVTAVYAKVGQVVKSGQLLAKVDPASVQRALDLAEANLDAAQDALDRAEDAGSDTTTAENNVTTAKLAVEDAQADVDGTKLTAPMAGTIIAVNGTVGSSASGSSSSSAGGAGGSSSSSSTSSGFMELADLGDLQVTASFGEQDATKLKIGQAATFTWDALSDATATGKVTAIDPSATTTNSVSTYGVTASVDTLPDGAKPGQSVSVVVTTGTATSAVSVSSAAVTVSGTRYTVTVLGSDGTTETRTVKVGVKGDDSYQITDGLTVGEKVVVPETSTSSSSTNTQSGSGSGFGSGSGGGAPGGGGGPP
ncbi:HlyD family efflux transporter periplasmic adaptor subunit [Actinoplanes sp. NPDC026619]|uniref:efflux RND transporter periplasmic adaptor subunit n=1 Tax=Actinoplanes sp. NPDC026619 TaxID=3155798 RepID=UPI0033F3027F